MGVSSLDATPLRLTALVRRSGPQRQCATDLQRELAPVLALRLQEVEATKDALAAPRLVVRAAKSL
jgi:hypothetical protein